MMLFTVLQKKVTLTRNDIMEKYKSRVLSCWVDRPTAVTPWYSDEVITLQCKYIDPSKAPKGFVNTAEDKYQYNFTDPISLTKTRYRPIAYRMTFPDFMTKNGVYRIYVTTTVVITGTIILWSH